MSDRRAKEGTPPPLLWMPPGGGLTLDVQASSANMLMPVIQTEPIFTLSDGEADSFLGQSPPKTTGKYFEHHHTASDPFLHIADTFTPLQHVDSVSSSVVPGSSSIPFVSTPATSSESLPPTNIYRQQGPRQYANPDIASYMPGSVQEPQVAPTPFTPAFANKSLTPAFLPSYTNVSSDTSFAQVPQGIYLPVQMHWCYCLVENNRDIWRPFSLVDSLNLEEAYTNPDHESSTTVQTDGGRYDVSLSARLRHSVYWDEEPSRVHRCSWFYKREVDGKYVPYSEAFADKLEAEYKNAVVNNLWHKRLEFEGGETIVMHNPKVIVHFQPSNEPDEWGTVQQLPSLMGDQMRPKVVKRGVDDFETINDGESSRVDHLVFIVHGIGSACDMKLRPIVECVDDIRSISLNLLKSHFKSHVIDGHVSRVEFLPVHWHRALHSDATGIDERLKLITLRSTAKLRDFINDTLMDVLFYTSPTYCQTICDTVTSEINRLYHLFLHRHPHFQGTVSVLGHSLGSSILFDILSHQGEPDISQGPVKVDQAFDDSDPPPAVSTQQAPEQVEGEGLDGDESPSLAHLLSSVGLQDKLPLFDEEQIDMDSITMCTEQDLKDLGLPMGPRKKLWQYVKRVHEKKERKIRAAEERAKHEKEVKEAKLMAERAELDRQAELEARKQSSLARGSVSVEYLEGVAGTGQPVVHYTKLNFAPSSLFAIGSPIGVFLTVRGVSTLGDEYHLPTCSRVFNIFHPYDPVAFRIEPLLNPSHSAIKPVLIPHHKGRKRLHLELKEGLARVGVDLKQRIISTLKTTWNSFNEFARAHRSETAAEDDVNDVIKQITDATEDTDDAASFASCHDEDIPMGALNAGRRIDYVLQEKPIESFNDYLFALASHLCYWDSEDTVLMILKEIYSLDDIYPSSENTTTTKLSSPSHIPAPSPPLYSSQVLRPTQSVRGTTPTMYPQQQTKPLPGNQPSLPPRAGPPPLSGFIRTK